MILSGSSSTIDFSRMEFIPECNREFPVACYKYDLFDRIEPWHWHDQFEIALIEGGNAVLNIEGTEYTVSSGEGYFVNSGALHSLANINGKKCGVRCVVFTKEFVGGFPDSVFFRKYLAPLSEPGRFSGCILKNDCGWQFGICGCIAKIFSLCESEEEMYELKTRELLTEAIALAANNIPAQKAKSSAFEQNYIAKTKTMLLFIWRNYGGPVTLSDIAKAGAVSKNECMLCFGKTVGISPIQYLKNYRLEKAEEMLRLTDKKVAEISELCGFQDKSYFTKAFREKFGETPFSIKKRK